MTCTLKSFLLDGVPSALMKIPALELHISIFFPPHLLLDIYEINCLILLNGLIEKHMQQVIVLVNLVKYQLSSSGKYRRNSCIAKR